MTHDKAEAREGQLKRWAWLKLMGDGTACIGMKKKGEVGSEATVMPKTGSDSGRKMLAGFVSKSMI